MRGAAAYGSPSLSGFCAVYRVFAFVLKIRHFFFFCHSTSAAAAQAVSVHPHRLCFGELCGVFESSPGQKVLSDVLQKRARQLCKLSGLLRVLYKVFRCAVQHEQRQRKAGIDFLLLVHTKKYIVKVSSQKGK